jgi:ketosteroid isomerase-like protein
MRDNTAQEAIAKLKAYEDNDRIEAGDEVTFLPNNRKGIVTACHVSDVYAENDKYAVFCGTTVEYVLRQHITKTGKHYDIASILEAMRK